MTAAAEGTRDALRIHASDDAAVPVRAIAAGVILDVDGRQVTLRDDVAAGHKIVLRFPSTIYAR